MSAAQRPRCFYTTNQLGLFLFVIVQTIGGKLQFRLSSKMKQKKKNKKKEEKKEEMEDRNVRVWEGDLGVWGGL
eukprot:CAMPEP_0201501906 /NCGR_PEP_ID=MMETSP0151_2-20130828/83845_1 /ASSEMBLY_ACC=CAM_ASM_000257 /TAXON_ID=200890 /ORGANISM="Paramoeba atlantica, Strain 621/1 / CCAP 1560/9" /LENGTH=73 /DNA_ID=CAMNT_0047895457 /DNA_START=1537 /DNA_END=1754 /DNA_ORIENTATION=+